jgi:hypothetical protein
LEANEWRKRQKSRRNLLFEYKRVCGREGKRYAENVEEGSPLGEDDALGCGVSILHLVDVAEQMSCLCAVLPLFIDWY